MGIKDYFKRAVLSFIFIITFSQVIFPAGVLYVRPRWSSATYEKMWIKSMNVDIQIQDQVAVTHVDQVFFNEMNQSVESIYIFPLPSNAMVTELVYWVNGVRYVAEIRERQDAINDYNDQLHNWLDPAMLEYLGDNMFRLSIVPIDPLSEVRTEITYTEIINYDFGISEYKYQLNTLGLSSQPLNTVHVNVEANSQNAFKYFSSPSHTNDAASQITKISDYEYSMIYGDENYYPDKDLVIQFETKRDEVQFSLLTYSPTEEDSMGTDKFYALWITPPDSVANEEIIPKDIVFTADVSSSMDGERLDQLKQSLTEFINLLNENDKFNIITFGTHIVKFKDDLVQVNSDSRAEALFFIEQLYALGMTNIGEALEESMSQSFESETSNNLVFLTDGLPTIGLTNTDSIIAHTTSANTNNVRLFSFGIGNNLNTRLLTEVSMQNKGYSKFIEANEDIASVINNHFKRISKPILSDIEINYGGLNPWDIYPKNNIDVFWGSRYVKMGLYNTSGEFMTTFTGSYMNNTQTFNRTLFYPDTGGFRFIPRLWAKAKIDHLLSLIEIYGETDELVNQIIELSLRFQILTEYTAFYVDPTDVKEESTIPTKYKVWQNYPNPFNPTTTIKYSIPEAGFVTIKVYDILGREIAVLVNEYKQTGTYEIKFDGSQLSSGVYLYRITSGNFSETRKMVLSK